MSKWNTVNGVAAAVRKARSSYESMHNECCAEKGIVLMKEKWIRRGRSKLQNTEGFTLSEMLMTVLLISLVGMAITGGIVAARNVYQRISLRADAQTLLATTVSALTEDLASVTSCTDADGKDVVQGEDKSKNVVVDLIVNGETENIYVYAGSRGYQMQYKNGTYKNDTEKAILIVPKMQTGAEIPLLPKKVQTRGLYAYIESLSVTKPQSGDGGYFTLKIQIKKDNQVIEKAEVCVHNRMK